MNKGYRVVYGETMPAWEKIFRTKYQAEEFAREQKRVGDTIFSIKKVVPGEGPQSMTALIDAEGKT
jgi:2-hydroxychromene-2-carboxylate isomerase